jgi:hypothetical protein
MPENDEQRAELVSTARELSETVDTFDGLAGLLRRVLPQLTEASGEAEFQDGVRILTEQLDDMAIHQLGMLVNAAWLYRDAADHPHGASHPGLAVAEPGRGTESEPHLRPRRRTPSLADAVQSGSRSPWGAELVDHIFNVGTYLAAAAAGGIVGNRADSGVLRALKAVRDRWRARKAADDAPLLPDEAIALAKAAAEASGHAAEGLVPLGATPRDDGSWSVRLRTGRDTLRVVLPPGDPGEALILFEAG